MIVIKRWIIAAAIGVAVLVATVAILLTTCSGKNDNENSSSAESSGYTQSELDEIREWWNNDASVIVE